MLRNWFGPTCSFVRGSSSEFTTAHTPERSGLPSGIFGAGADRFGLPSGVRGIPESGYFSHCAEAKSEAHTHKRDVESVRFILTSGCGTKINIQGVSGSRNVIGGSGGHFRPTFFVSSAKRASWLME